MRTLVFDTETTGLIDNHVLRMDRQPEIIEFAGVVVDLDVASRYVGQKTPDSSIVGEIERYETLVRPTGHLEAKIKRITGIVDSDLVGKPPFKDVAGRIAKLIEGSDAVVAHNLSFDMEMVDFEFERLGQKVEWPRRRICTVEQTIHMTGSRLKLDLLHRNVLGYAHVDAHRAMADVVALVRVAAELRRREMI